jgi:RNase P/RNase MRP subunit p29
MKKQITNMIRGELIGKKAIVFDRQHKKKLAGTIIDETKHLLTLETSTGYKKIQKQSSFIQINNIEIDGKIITLSPEDRIKVKL